MYLYLKAIHVFSVVLLIGGILLLALAIRAARPSLDERSRKFVETVLWWDGVATTPALAVVWMAGFTMAFGAGWDASTWLVVKMIPAVFLTGLHGIEGKALRRALRDGKPLPSFLSYAPAATLVAFAVIAWLAVVKPF